MSQAGRKNTTTAKRKSQDPASIVKALPHPPAKIMAALLRTMGTDLGDERQVIRVLIGARFSANHVKDLMDEAIALARGAPVI